LADHFELMRVHHHHPSHLAYHRLVEARRRAHRFHRQLVFRLQLGHKCSQLFDPTPPQPALSVFLPRAHHKLRAMQIHSQLPFHRRLLLLLLGSGVDASLRRSPNSHSSSYWPYGDASIAGLTNLCVEVVPPHGTSPACNLSAPELLSWSLPPQNRYPIHAISVVKGFFTPQRTQRVTEEKRSQFQERTIEPDDFHHCFRYQNGDRAVRAAYGCGIQCVAGTKSRGAHPEPLGPNAGRPIWSFTAPGRRSEISFQRGPDSPPRV